MTTITGGISIPDVVLFLHASDGNSKTRNEISVTKLLLLLMELGYC